MRARLSDAGHKGITPVLQGSAVTGKSFRTGKAFDSGRTSDLDVALNGPKLFELAKSQGIPLHGTTRARPLKQSDLKVLNIHGAAQALSTEAGRPVNFMIFNQTTTATSRSPSMFFPRN